MCYINDSVTISVACSDVIFLKGRILLSKVLNKAKSIITYYSPRNSMFLKIVEKTLCVNV